MIISLINVINIIAFAVGFPLVLRHKGHNCDVFGFPNRMCSVVGPVRELYSTKSQSQLICNQIMDIKSKSNSSICMWRGPIVYLDLIHTNPLGAEMPDSETTGDVMRRATSCSGWTEPRYNGITV